MILLSNAITGRVVTTKKEDVIKMKHPLYNILKMKTIINRGYVKFFPPFQGNYQFDLCVQTQQSSYQHFPTPQQT